MGLSIHQLAQLLRVATSQLAYCDAIVAHERNSKKSFNPDSDVDSLYKNICNLAFHDALLLTGGMLEKKSGRISFYNLDALTENETLSIEEIRKRYDNSGLMKIRHGLVAHQPIKFGPNRFPHMRRRGMVHYTLIDELRSINQRMIDLLFTHGERIGTPFSSTYFLDENARREIMNALEKLPPTMTFNTII